MPLENTADCQKYYQNIQRLTTRDSDSSIFLIYFCYCERKPYSFIKKKSFYIFLYNVILVESRQKKTCSLCI